MSFEKVIWEQKQCMENNFSFDNQTDVGLLASVGDGRMNAVEIASRHVLHPAMTYDL